MNSSSFASSSLPWSSSELLWILRVRRADCEDLGPDSFFRAIFTATPLAGSAIAGSSFSNDGFLLMRACIARGRVVGRQLILAIRKGFTFLTGVSSLKVSSGAESLFFSSRISSPRLFQLDEHASCPWAAFHRCYLQLSVAWEVQKSNWGSNAFASPQALAPL